MSRRWHRHWGLAALLLCACAQQPAGPTELTAPTAPTEQRAAADWVLQLELVHGRVDAALTAGELAAARGLLSEAVAAPVPATVGGEHRRVAHQDLLFRLAAVELQAGAADAAQITSERGLSLGRHDDLFTANLLLTQGRAREALGRDTEAADSYLRALKINEALLRATLARDGGTP